MVGMDADTDAVKTSNELLAAEFSMEDVALRQVLIDEILDNQAHGLGIDPKFETAESYLVRYRAAKEHVESRPLPDGSERATLLEKFYESGIVLT